MNFKVVMLDPGKASGGLSPVWPNWYSSVANFSGKAPPFCGRAERPLLEASTAEYPSNGHVGWAATDRLLKDSICAACHLGV